VNMLIRVNPTLGWQMNALSKYNGRKEDPNTDKLQSQKSSQKRMKIRPTSCFATVSREKINDKARKISSEIFADYNPKHEYCRSNPVRPQIMKEPIKKRGSSSIKK